MFEFTGEGMSNTGMRMCIMGAMHDERFREIAWYSKLYIHG
jgi:hypothetical protein